MCVFLKEYQQLQLKRSFAHVTNFIKIHQIRWKRHGISTIRILCFLASIASTTSPANLRDQVTDFSARRQQGEVKPNG